MTTKTITSQFSKTQSTSERWSFNITDAYKTIRGFIVFAAPVFIMNLEKLLNNSSLSLEDLIKSVAVGLAVEILRRFITNHQTINETTTSGQQTTTSDKQSNASGI